MGGPDEAEHNCPMGWLVEDIGRFLAGPGEGEDLDVRQRARGLEAVQRGAVQVNELLRSAFAAHEIVATELRITGRERGARRTVFADEPTPVALLLLCVRLCEMGDEVSVLHHTAGRGSTTRSTTWPFGMAEAERITRPPWDASAPVGGLEGFATGER